VRDDMNVMRALRTLASTASPGSPTRQAASMALDLLAGGWWCCGFCGVVSAAEVPYEVGDLEPCIYCDCGTARVMTLVEAISTARALSGRETSRPAHVLALMRDDDAGAKT